MTTNKFLEEIKKLDPRFSIIENPNRPGLSNILFEGKNYDLPVISSVEVKEEIDQTHRYEFPNGMSARHHSSPEIITRLEDFLKNFDSMKELYD